MQLKKTDIYFSFKLKACMTENHNYAVHKCTQISSLEGRLPQTNIC